MNETEQTSSLGSGKLKTMETSSKLPNVTGNPEITKAPKLAVNNKTSVIGESLRDNATLSSHATQSFSTTTDIYKNITKQTSKLPNVSGTPEQTKAPFLAVTNKTTKIGRNRQLRNFEDPKNLQSKSCGPSDGDKAAGSGDWRKEGLKIHNAYRKDHEAQPLQLDEKVQTQYLNLKITLSNCF